MADQPNIRTVADTINQERQRIQESYAATIKKECDAAIELATQGMSVDDKQATIELADVRFSNMMQQRMKFGGGR